MSYTENISRYITSWFESLNLPTEPSGLYSPIEYTLSSGGKRLRPTLLLASAMAFGSEADSVRNQCLGIEMFHNFTLLHDDLMDNADVRRGRATVHRRWSANTAVLSGDAMLTMATMLVADTKDENLRSVLDLFNRTAMEVYEGQQLDTDFENRNDVTFDEYIEMIRLKTSVLLACAVKMGAIVAGASPEAAEAMYNYGINLGLGFQLRDDYLDTFGDPLIFGKEIGGDIINDKKTWLMIAACQEDTTNTMRHALENRYDNDEKIAKVTEVYSALNLDNRILSLINDYSMQAIKSLDNVELNSEARQYFISLAKSLVNRMN